MGPGQWLEEDDDDDEIKGAKEHFFNARSATPRMLRKNYLPLLLALPPLPP